MSTVITANSVKFPIKLKTKSPNNPAMSLLGSSLLSRFSGVVDCTLVFFCFMSKGYLRVSTHEEERGGREGSEEYV